MGSKFSIIASFGIAGVSSLCVLYFSGNTELVSMFLFGCRLGVAAACNVSTILNITVFPSDFRSTSFGICNLFARLSAILAPLIAELKDPLPVLTFFLVTTLSAFLGNFLIEGESEDEVLGELKEKLIDKSRDEE